MDPTNAEGGLSSSRDLSPLSDILRSCEAWITEADKQLRKLPEGMERDVWSDLRKVAGVVVGHLEPSLDEDRARSAIANLQALMGRGLAAGAFLAARDLVEALRKAVGDTYLDLGPVSRSLDEAAEFLRRTLAEETKTAVRSDLLSGQERAVRDNFLFGMSVRNYLRAAGFTEQALGVEDLDDVWFELVRRAVL